jgi:hypothetical protein
MDLSSCGWREFHKGRRLFKRLAGVLFGWGFMAICSQQLIQLYSRRPGAAPRAQEPARESVQEFVAYLIEFIRDDAGMMSTLDRALKERYGKRHD